MSPPLSSSTSTTPTCPAVAARIRGVKPGEKVTFDLVNSNFFHKELTLYVPVVQNIIKNAFFCTFFVPMFNVGPPCNENRYKFLMSPCTC